MSISGMSKWLAGLLLALLSVQVQSRSLVMISMDGLRPQDLHAATAAELPSLRRLFEEGSHASSVRGIMPTLTYPSHATLLTGVSPAKHGIASNLTFDPQFKNQLGWFWYAADFRSETLWDAARKRGLSTASVHWPTSVGANVDANLPQIWRTGHEDDRKLLAALATPGLLQSLEKELGPYPDGIDESIEADEVRARFAAKLFELRKPDFMTVYFAGLDHEEHRHGPGSAQAHDALRRLDAAVGMLVAALRRAEPDTVVVLVSDHGFVPLRTDVNLAGAFVQAGLATLDASGQVAEWKAGLWPGAGSAAVVLKDANDIATRNQVQGLLAKLAADPANGIERIVDAQGIDALGATSADWLVLFKPGYEFARNPAAPLLSPSGYRGMHGYSPEHAEMDAILIVAGNGVPRRDLGRIDMRDIAPTLAGLLRLELPEAEGHDLLH